MIHNTTSNCPKLVIPHGRLIYDVCINNNYRDPKLDSWTERSSGLKQNAQKIAKNHRNYLYCYPGSITIDNQKMECPAETIKLALFQSLETGDETRYEASTEFKNISAIQKLHSISLCCERECAAMRQDMIAAKLESDAARCGMRKPQRAYI